MVGTLRVLILAGIVCNLGAALSDRVQDTVNSLSDSVATTLR